MGDVLAKSLALVLGLAACLMLSAGRWSWVAGWVLIAEYAGFVVLALVLVDHRLLRERAQPTAGFDARDARLATIGFLLLYPAAMAVAGVDAVRLGLSPDFPAWLRAVGAFGFLLGYGFALWAMIANPFFSTFVRIQADRRHTLVDRGPYAWVRHPGYAGMLAAHWLMPALLGSLWAYVPIALGTAVFAMRTLQEERTLDAGLPGYADYRAAVPWRLAPWVW